MTQSKLIGKKAYITDKESLHYNDYGTIQYFDGECYHIAIFNDADYMPIFNRNQFLVKRKSE